MMVFLVKETKQMYIDLVSNDVPLIIILIQK